MSRVIDADKLHYHKVIINAMNWTHKEAVVVFAKDIYKAEIIDAVPVVHGRWIPHTIYAADDCSALIGLAGYKCSVCGRFESEKEPYCNCGARMDGGDK